jgi:zinc protease
LGRLRDDGLDAAMVDSSRNYIMGQFPPRLETAAQLAGVFAMLELNGLDASYIDDYGSSLTLATEESIAAVIDQVYPSSDGLVFVILGDAGNIREQVAEYGPITEISISVPRFHPQAP